MTDSADDAEFSPVLDFLTSSMKVDVIVKPDGSLWLLYDRPINNKISWLEYDQSDQSLTLVTENGQIQDLGMTITDVMRPCLLNSTCAIMAFVSNGKIETVNEVTITVRE